MAHIDKNGRLVFNKITSDVVVTANYLACKKDDSKVDDFISIYTGIFPWNWGTPGLSHTEFGICVDNQWWFFSSTSRPELGAEKQTGTRWVRGDVLLRHSERWKLQGKLFGNTEIWHVIRNANALIPMKYDFDGVIADFILPIDFVIKKNRIYCSKAVHYAITGTLRRISPRQHYRWAKKNGFVDIANLPFVGDCDV